MSDLERLETLRLDFTMIDDVRALRPLKTLKKLGLAEVELSTVQMNGLKKSLPRCTIER